MGFFLAPFSGFAVGGGSGSLGPDYVTNVGPAGTGRNAGPARSPLRLMGQDGKPLKKRWVKVLPPGQFPAMAPPYSWEPHEREDWVYHPGGDTTGKFPKAKRHFETRFFSSSLLLIELDVTKSALADPAKQQIIQLHTKAQMLRQQIAQLRQQAHQLVQTHKQKTQQAQQFRAADQAKAAAQGQATAAQARQAARGPRIPRQRPTQVLDKATSLGKQTQSSINKYRLMRPVGEDQEDEPYGLEGGSPKPYMPDPDKGSLPTRPPAAYSQNPKKAARQAHAWSMSIGRPQSPKAEPVGLTHGEPKRQASPETQQLLSVHQRIAQLRQQLTGIMAQIKQLRGRSAAVAAKPVGEASWSSTSRKI